ncbi:MAG: hypothetical protein E7323_07695 [Clostridiales bacterium]|nr:hypothetical protein [Clostridiales bacterium]
MKKRLRLSPAARDKRRGSQRIFGWLLALLCLSAAVLTLLHLRPDATGAAYFIAAPRNLTRAQAQVPDAVVQSPEVAVQPQVQVNLASVDELITIPGVGPTLAQAIIDERTTNGFFYYPEDLLCVKGIGEKTLPKLLPYVNLD